MNINVNNKSLNVIILISSIILVIMRHIEFFIYPRFWAEEGKVYFLDAYTNGFSSLWHTHQGYYSVIPNFATYFSTYVPLEYAPIVTTFIAFLVQVLPFYLIFISKSDLLNTSFKKILASMVVLFIAQDGEIWLNTITSQFHFIIILFLLLIDNKSVFEKFKKTLYLLLAFVAGLSGVPANILAPIFFYNYFITKEKANLYIFWILSITTALQVICIITSTGNNRMLQPNFDVIGNIFISTFQYPIFYSSDIGKYTIAILPLLYILIKTISQKKYFLLFFGTSLLLTSIMTLTSVGMNGGGRYIYASSVIFILGLVMASFDASINKFIRIFLSLYIIHALKLGILHFPIKDGSMDSTQWKRWKDEVILFQNHSTDTITIYPQLKHRIWSVTLPKKQSN